jgi:hypothetical protein
MSDESFERVLLGNSTEVQEIAERVRGLVLERMPNAVEWIDTGNGLGAYGTERKMSAILFAIIPHKAHVNLQFADGADLDDPDGLVEGTGKRIASCQVPVAGGRRPCGRAAARRPAGCASREGRRLAVS